MKEYSIAEVINNIEDGEEYKSDSPIWEIKSIKKVNGNINFIYNGAKNDSVGVNANQRFIKVETPVSFMEAINAGLEGKRIKVEDYSLNDSWNNIYFRINKIFEMLGKATLGGIPSIIKEGKWYIEED